MTNAPVLMIGNFLSGSGGNRGVCEELAVRLAHSGVPTVTASSQSSKVARLADMLATVWRERSRYRVAQIDVFSGPAFFWAESVCWLLRKIGKPFVLSLHGGALPEFATLHASRVRRLLSGATEVTSPSPYLIEAMARFRRGIRLVPNGLELADYNFRLRRDPLPRLVWLRAFHATYDPVMAVRVLRAVSDQAGGSPAWRAGGTAPFLTMYGPDKNDGGLEATIAAAGLLGVSSQLHIAGPIAKSAVPVALGRSDIFLNTSTTDNTPVSVLEAMACGLCVVSTDVGGISRLLSNGSNALLVPAGDPGAMASAVIALLRDSCLAEKLSANARRSAESFDWAKILPQWHDVLRSAADVGGSI